ncbi:helix-turn-helix domain-containing protein [Campylobacter concisus]
MSIRIMSQVWNMEIDDSTAKLTLMALADFSDDEGYCYPSYEVLAKKISKSKRTAIRAVEKLTELGFLQKEKRELKDGTSSANLYKILSEKDRVTQTHPRVTNEKERVTSMTLPSDTDDTPRVTSMTPCSDKGVTPINITTNRTVSRTIKEPSINPLPPKGVSLPDFIDPSLWQKYLAYKKERREKLSTEGIEMKFSEWAKWASEGIDVNACIREAMANEWQGVFKPKTQGGSGRNMPNNATTNPHGLNQGTLNTMRAFREFEAQLIANGQGHRVGGNYDDK